MVDTITLFRTEKYIYFTDGSIVMRVPPGDQSVRFRSTGRYYVKDKCSITRRNKPFTFNRLKSLLEGSGFTTYPTPATPHTVVGRYVFAPRVANTIIPRP